MERLNIDICASTGSAVTGSPLISTWIKESRTINPPGWTKCYLQFKQSKNIQKNFTKKLLNQILKQQNSYVVLSQKRIPSSVFYFTKHILEHHYPKLPFRIKVQNKQQKCQLHIFVLSPLNHLWQIPEFHLTPSPSFLTPQHLLFWQTSGMNLKVNKLKKKKKPLHRK